MSDLAIFSGTSLPAHIRKLGLDATTKALMSGGGGGFPGKRISIEGSVWRLLSSGQEIAQREERSLNVVIVAASERVGRVYYEGIYEKGKAAPPACWSSDGERPDDDVPEPQSETCAECPQNVKGSGTGDTRACRYFQRLAVVLENDLSGDVYQLQLPATSIFGEGEAGKWPLHTYARMLGSREVPIVAVVTEMRFDTAASVPKVVFKPVRVLDEDELDVVMDQGKSEEAQEAIAMHVYHMDAVKDVAEEFAANPKVKPRKAKEPEPVEEEEYEDEEEEVAPPPKKTRKPKKVKEPEPDPEEEEDEEYEDEEEEVAPPPKKTRKPKKVKEPEPEENDEEEEEEIAPPKKAKSKKPEAKAPSSSADVLAILDDWDD